MIIDDAFQLLYNLIYLNCYCTKMESKGTTRQVTMKEDDNETYQSLESDTTPYCKSVEGYILCITGINEEA